MDYTAVSLVCTVRDEADNIAALLEFMLAQSRPADEIVVNDCASRDATPAIVERYIAAGHPIRLVRGGHNIPSGRNNAIRHARGPPIACTDAGLTLDPLWLERIVVPLARGEADVVGGFCRRRSACSSWRLRRPTTARPRRSTRPRFCRSASRSRFARRPGSAPAATPSGPATARTSCSTWRCGVTARASPSRPTRWCCSGRASRRARSRDSTSVRPRGDGVANLLLLRHAIRYGTYGAAAASCPAGRRARAASIRN